MRVHCKFVSKFYRLHICFFISYFLVGCSYNDIIISDDHIRKNIENIEIRTESKDYVSSFISGGPHYPQGKYFIRSEMEFDTTGLPKGLLYPPDYSKYDMLYFHNTVYLDEVTGYSIFINHRLKRLIVHFSGVIKGNSVYSSHTTSTHLNVCIPKIPNDYKVVW